MSSQASENAQTLRAKYDHLMAQYGSEASPAHETFYADGMTEDGWPNYIAVRVGDIVTSSNGHGLLWRVIGFTRDNGLVLRPYGLGHDAKVSTVRTVTSRKA